jgi:hypothetical protein
VDLVCLVCFVHLVDPISLVQPNKQDKPNKHANQIAISRVEVGIMPQAMVDRSISDSDRFTRPNDSRLSISRFASKYLLLKMPYRFNTSYQLLARHCLRALCDWFPSLAFRRSRP